MNAFCQRQGMSQQGVRFLFDGERLNGNQTPAEARRAAPLELPASSSAAPASRPPRSLALRAHPPSATPQLDMEDGDVIDVMVEQLGGAC